jgi:hypothetical protein
MPSDIATNLIIILFGIGEYIDIHFKARTYTFLYKFLDFKKTLIFGANKLQFKVIGGLMYLMRYLMILDWYPNNKHLTNYGPKKVQKLSTTIVY